VPGSPPFEEKNKEKETTSQAKCHVGGSSETSSTSRVHVFLLGRIQTTRHHVWYLVSCTLFAKGLNKGPKHMRQLTTLQVFLPSREEISLPGIEPPTSSLRFGYLSTIIQKFRVISDLLYVSFVKKTNNTTPCMVFSVMYAICEGPK
jgi:hypothetical protein